MADKVLKSITFPNLPDRYIIPQVDDTLSESGSPADAKKTGDEISAVKEDLTDLSTDGVVASAEQLLSDKYTVDQVPYHYRASASGGADREYDEIVGGSVVQNQLIKLPADGTTYSGVTFNIADGVITLSGTATAGYINCFGSHTTKAGHAYLINTVSIANPNNVSLTIGSLNSYINTVIGGSKIFKPSGSVYDTLGIQSYGGSGVDLTGIKFKVIIIDLTQMLGTTIADYIYLLEQATTGAGVAWFKKLFPKDYYEYNAGSMEHVSGISAHEMVGFNQWDEEWEVGEYDGSGVKRARSNAIRSVNYIPCFPATTYYWKCASHATADGVLNFYDENRTFISRTIGTLNKTLTTPTNAHYMTFYVAPETTYKNDICINLHWSGTRNGEYEPYVKHSYPLDSSLTLRGIPKLDASGNLYYDGDTYAADGTVTRKYGVVTLNGSSQENWVKSSSYPGGYYWGEWVNTHSIKGSINHVQNNNLATITGGIEEYSQKTNVVYFDGSLNIKLDQEIYPTLESFRSYLQATPVTIVYELKTPTTETATPYRSLQKVDPYGTEEYVSTSLIPVGHYTKYPENLRAKIENLDLSMIAPIETGTTASQAYAIGKYFLLNNKFCKAKTAIASGATFTLGTNYEVTTIADELYTALNA